MIKRPKIAITGVGGGVGQSIVKSLYNSGFDLVGLDGEFLGTGLYAVPVAYVIPYARSVDFIPALLEICAKEKIDILFPGMDAELAPLSLNSEKFLQIGTKVVVSRPEVIEISDDKLVTYRKLSAIGISVPKTIVLRDFVESGSRTSYPLIVKQHIGGARSRNVFYIKDQNAINKLISTPGFDLDNFVVQEFIDGEEYTCGTVNLENHCQGVIVMRRELRDGDTYKCFSVKNDVIESEVRKIMENIKPFGACNVQLRMKEGKVHVFEINARCSGTTYARTLCGFNEPTMIANFIISGKKPEFEISEKTVLRYWKELLIDNDQVDYLKKNRSLSSSNPLKL